MPRKLLLVLGAREPDPTLAELPALGFELALARTPDAAEVILREHHVSLAIASPGATNAAVEQLVASIQRLKAKTPVLAIRERDGGVPEGWTQLGIGVLRPPLLPGALARSVEVVLGLRR